MATCIFGEYVYVFGGEREFSELPKIELLIRNYSTTIERLHRGIKKWDIVPLAEETKKEWGGCGLSAAIPTNDSIMIVGGYIRNKDGYEWQLNYITYTPSTRKFTERKTFEEGIRVEFFFNSGYHLQNNVFLLCSNFPNDIQAFYTFGPKGTNYARHAIRKQ